MQEKVQKMQEFEEHRKFDEHMRQLHNQVNKEKIRKYREQKAQQLLEEQERMRLMHQQHGELEGPLKSIPMQTRKRRNKSFYGSHDYNTFKRGIGANFKYNMAGPMMQMVEVDESQSSHPFESGNSQREMQFRNMSWKNGKAQYSSSPQ